MKSVTILQGLNKETAIIVAEALRKQYSGEVVSMHLANEALFEVSIFDYNQVTPQTECIVFNGADDFQLRKILRDFENDELTVNPKYGHPFKIPTPAIVINIAPDTDVTILAAFHPVLNAI